VVRSDGTSFQADTPDSISSILTTRDGAAVSLHVAQGTHTLVTTRISVTGSRGALQLLTTAPGGVQMAESELWGAKTPSAALELLSPPLEDQRVAQPGRGAAVNVAETLQEFGNDIRHGTSNLPTFDDAVRRHQSLDRLARANRALI